MIIFSLSVLNVSFLPLNAVSGPLIYSDFSLVYIIIISSLQTFGFIISAWCSQSSYSLLASLRISASVISYEAVLLSCIIILAVYTRSLNIENIIFLQRIFNIKLFYALPVVGIIFFISFLAELNRIPFDMAETESELVSGYNVEYSGFIFALFFLAEYTNIIFTSVLMVMVFFNYNAEIVTEGRHINYLSFYIFHNCALA